MRLKGQYTKGMPHISDAEYLAKLKSLCKISESGCWEIQTFRRHSRDWEGGSGYGEMSYRGKTWRAHRLAFRLVKGPIPAGHVVRHTCNNQCCCNPDHVVSGTQKDNIADCIKAGNQQFHPSHYTHCKHGHPFEATARLTKEGWRACKVCQRAAQRKTAGWPESHWYLPSQKLGHRPDFEMNRGTEHGR
jgi:hypothetical protein